MVSVELVDDVRPFSGFTTFAASSSSVPDVPHESPRSRPSGARSHQQREPSRRLSSLLTKLKPKLSLQFTRPDAHSPYPSSSSPTPSNTSPYSTRYTDPPPQHPVPARTSSSSAPPRPINNSPYGNGPSYSTRTRDPSDGGARPRPPPPVRQPTAPHTPIRPLSWVPPTAMAQQPTSPAYATDTREHRYEMAISPRGPARDDTPEADANQTETANTPAHAENGYGERSVPSFPQLLHCSGLQRVCRAGPSAVAQPP